MLDPGFGFGKTAQQNMEMLANLRQFTESGYPVLAGLSRKSTLGAVLDSPVDRRLEATISAVSLCVAGGADIVRVHDVAEVSRAVQVADAIVRGNWQEA